VDSDFTSLPGEEEEKEKPKPPMAMPTRMEIGMGMGVAMGPCTCTSASAHDHSRPPPLAEPSLPEWKHSQKIQTARHEILFGDEKVSEEVSRTATERLRENESGVGTDKEEKKKHGEGKGQESEGDTESWDSSDFEDAVEEEADERRIIGGI
jgi:hypothetical protein